MYGTRATPPQNDTFLYDLDFKVIGMNKNDLFV